MQDCIFCKIINKEAEAGILFENEESLAFTPLDAITNGHVLVVPKKHFENIFDIDEKTLADLIVTAKKIAEDIVKEKGATGVNLLNASGKDAQQSVPHFHIHIIPRFPNDGLDLWLKNKL